MNILLIGYWSIHEGLTQSTIIPHLRILSEMDKVEHIIFVSIERKEMYQPININNPKIIHTPLHSKNVKLKFINKWLDFTLFPTKLKDIIKNNNIELCIGVGTQAGTLAHKASASFNIPFIVSFYDPHASYMQALGVWKKYDLRYLLLSLWENQLKIRARYIFPVSNRYYKTLIQDGVDIKRLKTVPCTTDLEHFEIDLNEGKSIRKELNWDEKDLVGVYVGKFGDIYFYEEAFNLFSLLKKRFPVLKLIILTGQDKLIISSQLINAGFSEKDFFVSYTSHCKVPDFLNASNFAFCLHKPHYISYAYSPIKNGEYWACGLPVIIPDGIGDDSQILKETGLGVVMEDIEQPEKYFPQLEKLIQANKKEEIRQLAIKYRNPEITRRTYQKIISELCR